MENTTNRSLLRLQTTARHLLPPSSTFIFDETHLEWSPCDAKDDSSSNAARSITLGNLEIPETSDIEEKFPNVTSVTLFPLFSRPLFPHVRIRAIPRFETKRERTASAIDLNARLNQALSKLRSSNDPKANAIVYSARIASKGDSVKRIATLSGPAIITDKDFIETIVKLKSNGDAHIALSLSKNPRNTNTSSLDSFHSIGVLARIDNIQEINHNDVKYHEVVLTVTHRVEIVALNNNHSTSFKPITGSNSITSNYPRVSVKEFKEEVFNKESKMSRALFLSMSAKVHELCKLSHPLFLDQLDLVAFKIDQREPSELADLCASLCFHETSQQLQLILQESDVNERMKKVLLSLKQETEVCKLISESKITTPGSGATESSNASSSNQNPLRRLLSLNGNGASSERTERNNKVMAEFRERLKGLVVPEHAQKVIDEEMNKLSSLDSTYNATEHYTCRNYLNWLTNVPWGVYTKDNLDLINAQKILDEDHYGLSDIKERIMEFIAVASLKGTLHGKIICFVGPPGVGKTSMGKSIARAIGRKFYRFSVGGMNDVAEIKGHRRTYIGALPGKFIQSLKVTKSSNPVILIDEIDKISKSWDGDPASALLEALDPEQNNAFLDHYLDVSFDLSKVLFICTANDLSTIPRPLLDRMEIIKLSGYFLDEKICIAKSHILPNALVQSGLTREQVTITDEALKVLIGMYCREAGVRSLQKQIEKILRKVAYQIAKGESSKIEITESNLENYVGKPKFLSDRMYEVETTPPGIVIGLAFNSVGGSLIWIESVLVPTSNSGTQKPNLKVTGKLGEVMKESTDIAYTFAKGFSHKLEPNNTFFEKGQIHMHFPEGATPKDGPSAGCAIVTSFLSLFLNKPVKPNLAMTGEISLTGKVLPIGGIREKTMAAKRSGIKHLILPEQNKKAFDELPPQLKSDFDVHFVSEYKQVFDLVFSH